jgi:hypothetical protein
VSAFTLLKSETLAMTSKLAIEIASMPGSDTERVLDEKRIDYLRGQVVAGLATPFNWVIAERPDGTRVRMNGNHSSNMLSKLDGDMPAGLTAVISVYKVEDRDGEVALFRQFDSRRSSRTIADIAGAFQGVIPELRSVPRVAAKKAIEGIAWHIKNIVGAPVAKGDDVYTLFHDPIYVEYIVWVGHMLSDKTRELQKAPVLAAIYATYDRDPEEAKMWWHQVARGGEEFADKAPSTVLDKWLQEERAPKPRRKAMLSDANFYQGCVFAWNAHRDGKEIIERINYDTKKGFFEVA